MACSAVFRQKMRPLSCIQTVGLLSFNAQRRSFLSLPGTEVITLNERRVLPYNSKSLYSLISDVDRYSDFIPYCQESKVKKWSSPDDQGRKWPEEADLKVGWGGIEEIFTSRLYCVPDAIVEALSGDAVTTIPETQLTHHSSLSKYAASSNPIFKRMSTRWSVKPLHSTNAIGDSTSKKTGEHPGPRTEVDLRIEFQFSNPLYGSLSKAVAPKLAEVMIEAFEKRAQLLLAKS